jgi:hypothetical protein
MKFLKPMIAALIAASAMAAVPARAASYTFACLSNTYAQNCADGETSLFMDVTDAGGGLVDFTFYNYSGLGSAITEVYFDDGSLLDIATLIDSGSGVNFTSAGATPPNLPSGSNAEPGFETTAGFSVDVEKKTSDGVENVLDGGTQEFITIRFSLIDGKTFQDTLDSLDGIVMDANGAPALRVGLHVRSFDSNSLSESFINTVTAIPEAHNYAMIIAGLGLLGAAMRRRARR